MSRRNRLADIDPLSHNADDDDNSKRAELSMNEADAALFGELTRRESMRQTVRPISIFSIYPDIKQPRRAIPLQVRGHWSGEPKDIANLFNEWLKLIDQERLISGNEAFDLNDYLWSEAIELNQRGEDESGYLGDTDQTGPVEKSFLQVVALAVSIRRDSLANSITVQRVGPDSYQLETGERRWLAYHILFGYFNGDGQKPQERDKWESIPASLVDSFSVWRQASENNARADLNAIGRARQFALLMIDLLSRQGAAFQSYETLIQPGQSDRNYYAQVIPHRVPKGKGEMLLNGLGVAHRAAFTRCRALLGLPDEIWLIGDSHDLTEDDLLRLAKMESVEEAIKEAQKSASNVATRNKRETQEQPRRKSKPPTLFNDRACKRGKKLFSKQDELAAKEIFAMCSGVGQANTATKLQIRIKAEELRNCLDQLEDTLDS